MSEMDMIDKMISNAHLAATGWQLETHESGEPISSHPFYTVDFRSRSLNLYAVSFDQIEAEVKRDKKNDMPMEELASVIGEGSYLLNKRNKKLSSIQRNKIEQSVLNALVKYIVRTQTFALWRGKKDASARMHSLINIYGSRQGAQIRPAILDVEGTIIPPEKISQFATTIAKGDLRRHPEWFR